MTELQSLQRQVASAIRWGDDALDSALQDTPAVPRAVRLGIYQDAYALRLDEALRANYPKLHRLLGDEDCLALTRAYLQAHPSTRASIRWFGDQLANFLSTAPRYSTVPALADLARFEWALGCAFDAGDRPFIGIDALASLSDDDWQALRPRFQPAFRMLDLRWNAPAVWQALDQDRHPPAPEVVAQHWAVWRCNLQPHFRSLTVDEAALLAALLAGQPFATACESLLPWHEASAVPIRAASLLGRWLADGWLGALQ